MAQAQALLLMRDLPHSVRGRGSSTSTSSAALRAEFYYRLRGFKKGMKLHPQEGQKPCVQQSMGIVENGACLPAVAVADAFASSLAREMSEQKARLAELNASFTKNKVLHARNVGELARSVREINLMFKEQMLKEAGLSKLQQTQMLAVLDECIVKPVNGLGEQVDRLSARVKSLEGELPSQRTTSGAAAGVPPLSSMAPQQPVQDEAPCAPQQPVRTEAPFPIDLIIDKRDEAYLAGLSELAREAVLEQRQAANWQWVRQKDGAPSDSACRFARLRRRFACRFACRCLPIRPTPQRARKVSFADLPLERVDTVPQSAPLAPFDECRSLEAAWLELYGGIVSKKAARHLLDVRGMKERPNADYAMLAMAARGTRC